jgi:hypothetical protein
MMGLIMLLAGVLVTSLSFTSMDSSASHMLAGIILLLLGKSSCFRINKNSDPIFRNNTNIFENKEIIVKLWRLFIVAKI